MRFLHTGESLGVPGQLARGPRVPRRRRARRDRDRSLLPTPPDLARPARGRDVHGPRRRRRTSAGERGHGMSRQRAMKKQSRKRTRSVWMAAGTLAAYAAVRPSARALAAETVPGAATGAAAPATLPVRRFEIGPGPLGAVLEAYRAASGVKVNVPDAGLLQIPSPGVTGVMSVEVALKQLLVGTTVGFRFKAADTRRADARRVGGHGRDRRSAPRHHAQVHRSRCSTRPRPSASSRRSSCRSRPTRRCAKPCATWPASFDRRRRGRRPGRLPHAARLLGAQRHLRRRDARFRQLLPRSLPPAAGRGPQGTLLLGIRPRIHRRRHQPVDESCPTLQSAPAPSSSSARPRPTASRPTSTSRSSLGTGAAFQLSAMGNQNHVAGRDVTQNRRWGRRAVDRVRPRRPDPADAGVLPPDRPRTSPTTASPGYFNEPAAVDRANYYGFADGSFLDTGADMGTIRFDTIHAQHHDPRPGPLRQLRPQRPHHRGAAAGVGDAGDAARPDPGRPQPDRRRKHGDLPPEPARRDLRVQHRHLGHTLVVGHRARPRDLRPDPAPVHRRPDHEPLAPESA